jgi:hypothetical protein
MNSEYTILGDSLYCEKHRDGIICHSCYCKIDGTVVEVRDTNKGQWKTVSS